MKKARVRFALVSLREYFDAVLAERQRAVELQFGATSQQVQITASALEARLESMNEFRAQISEERADYARRDYLDMRISSLDSRLKTLEGMIANMSGRFWALGIVWSLGASLSVAFFVWYLSHGAK